MSESASPSTNRNPPQTGALRWGLIVFAVMLLAIFGLPRGCKVASDLQHQGDVMELFGGQEILDIIQHPDRVTAQRVELLPSDEWTERVFQDVHVANYRRLDEPVVVSSDVTTRLANCIMSGSSYDWHPDADTASGRTPYGMKVDFVDGNRRVAIWFSVQCDFLVIVVDEEFNPANIAAEHCDPAHEELADIMHALFPKDQAL